MTLIIDRLTNLKKNQSDSVNKNQQLDKNENLMLRDSRKKSRNFGQKYINSKGQKVAPSSMKGPYFNKCRLQCTLKIINEHRRKREYYWNLGNIDSQRNFISVYLSEINSTYRNSKIGSNRSKHFKHTFTIENTPIQVYKTFFKNTLAINNRIIFTVTKKRDENNLVRMQRK